MKKEKLFEQFPPVSTREWMDKIQSDLKGADFSKKLIWKTNEGFEVQPFYRREDLENILPVGAQNGNCWKIRQDIEVADFAEANKKALTILMKGINSVGFIISDPESVSLSNFKILLNEIHTDAIEISFLCNGKAREILEIIQIISEEQQGNPEDVTGAIEADPLGRLMVNGKLCVPVSDGFDYLADLTRSAASLPELRTINLKASAFANSGADIVQELAFAISMGTEYLSQLTERGIAAELAASKIRFSFGIGAAYFPEIAKLRAARILWSVVQKGFGIPSGTIKRMDIHCVTGRWNKTVYDPYVNMLRTQTESMSAILGGTDSLTVEPFDAVFRNPEEFSERIARNQQLILKEESHFDKVADPSAGSYYIENLTGLIADNAWKLYLLIEEKGGFLSALQSGLIQKELSESAAKRMADVSTRKTVLLGTNQYPKSGETLPASADTGKLFRSEPDLQDNIVDPIIPFRGSELFDRIRIAVDHAEKRPAVFLLAIGNPVMRKARAQFSAGFFGCAGYTVLDNPGFESREEAIKTAGLSKADIVVICSSDEEYAQYAPGISDSLKDKMIVVIAGNPACADELKALGINHFIHVRTNIPETLNYFNRKLGITAW